MMEMLLDEIARNGFTKILIVNGHGGNTDFLHYFMMDQMNREVNYTLYCTFLVDGENLNVLKIWDTVGGGHADELETSLAMAVMAGTV